MRYANITIIDGIGATQYGVGRVAARVAEVILRDERAVFPVGFHNPLYDVALSLPSVVGREGVAEVILPKMPAAETAAAGAQRRGIGEGHGKISREGLRLCLPCP